MHQARYNTSAVQKVAAEVQGAAELVVLEAAEAMEVEAMEVEAMEEETTEEAAEEVETMEEETTEAAEAMEVEAMEAAEKVEAAKEVKVEAAKEGKVEAMEEAEEEVEDTVEGAESSEGSWAVAVTVEAEEENKLILPVPARYNYLERTMGASRSISHRWAEQIVASPRPGRQLLMDYVVNREM